MNGGAFTGSFGGSTSSGGGGGGSWGSITGTIGDQEDLQSALNTKANDVRHGIGMVSGATTIDPTLGNYQDCWTSGDTTFNFSTNGNEGDVLRLCILFDSGNHVIDIGADIELPSLGGTVFPFNHETWRSSRFQFEFFGGRWCLTSWSGFFIENVD